MYQSAYIAKEGLESYLLKELNDKEASVKNALILSKKPYRPLFFMQCGWIDPVVIPFVSINDAIRKLKALSPFFAFYPINFHRRGELIQEGLRKIKTQKISYDAPLPKYVYGGFTLLDEQTLFAAKTTTSYYPHGIVPLLEDKTPPSRAYLKLLEALHLTQRFPKAGEKCLEIGASPGSWTYFLAKMGLDVMACDRSELDPKVMQAGNIQFIKGDAFKLTPDKVGSIDWLFSDIICYPEKLLEYVQVWIDSKLCPNIICTIKFQGEIDLEIARKFQAIPKSQVMHLYHNKHELTFTYFN